MSPYSITPGSLIVALDIGKNVHRFGCYRIAEHLIQLDSLDEHNRHLRAKLVQAAWAAIKVKKSYFAACFQRLAGRRGAKRAIIAIAHRILIALYHMLKQRKPFEDLGATYYDERHQAQLIKRTERRFAQLGLKITVEPLPAA